MSVAFTPPDRATLRREGCFLVDPAGRKLLDLAGPPGADQGNSPSQEFGRRLRGAFAAECAAQDVRGSLVEAAEGLRIEFDGQENASPGLMRTAYLAELLAAGVLAAPTLTLPEGMDRESEALAENALTHGLRRLRTLLVEHNSYLSGGLRYPFPPSTEGVAERGLAIYRFPRDGDVTVAAVGDRIRIAFAAGDLGPVTSSGFYLPTLFAGDFTVETEYELTSWQPSEVEPACFALFAQNRDSARRYYAQRMSTGTGPHRLVASMVDVLSPPLEVSGRTGSLQVSRRDGRLRCSHRTSATEVWTEIGAAPAPPDPEMIVGAKIWSKLRCGGLTAELYNFRITGSLAEVQVPPVPVVPDPRSNSEIRP